MICFVFYGLNGVFGPQAPLWTTGNHENDGKTIRGVGNLKRRSKRIIFLVGNDRFWKIFIWVNPLMVFDGFRGMYQNPTRKWYVFKASQMREMIKNR